MIALVLAGLHTGWARLPLRLRGPDPRRRWFEGLLYRSVTGIPSPWSDGPPPTAGDTGDAADGTERGSHPADPARHEGHPPTPPAAGEVGRSGGSPPPLPPAPADSVDEGESPVGALAYVRAQLTEERLTEPAVAEAAARLCARLKLEALVRTRLQVGRRRFTWTGTAVEVDGFSAPEFVVDPGIIRHLVEYEPGNINEIKTLAALLGQDRTPARRGR